MFWLSIMRTLSRFLLPPSCVLCGGLCLSLGNLCAACKNALPAMPPSCAKCAQFLPLSTHLDLICGDCQVSPPPFSRIYALYPYEFPLTSLIIKLKFQHSLPVSLAFAQCFVQQIKNEWYRDKPLPDVIIPLPLHPRRLRSRGFNQATEIARPLAKALGIPLDTKSTKRCKYTEAQSGLPAKKREANVRHAFHTDQDFTGRHIAVLDDVVTTGHTMRAFCELLKSHHATQIDVWCVALSGMKNIAQPIKKR